MKKILLARIVVLLFIASPYIWFYMRYEPDYITDTRGQLIFLYRACEEFHSDHGRYPDHLNELIRSDIVSWDGPYLDGRYLPKDFWRHEFVYQIKNNIEGPILIYSLGADGVIGGDGINEDIYISK